MYIYIIIYIYIVNKTNPCSGVRCCRLMPIALAAVPSVGHGAPQLLFCYAGS